MLRLDQHFSAATTGFMRFNYDRSVDTQPLSAAATDLQQRVSTPVNGALELLHIFSSRLVNEAKFGFNRATSNTYNLNKTGILYQIAIATGPGPGFITQNYDYNSIYVGNSFSWIDNLTWIHGRHTFKFGGEIRRIQLNQESGEHGKITFSTVEDLAANLVTRASLSGALPVNHLRKNDYVGYAQDEYKWGPNLTLNLGVRYTIFDLFHEAEGLANPFDFATCGPQGFCGVGASFGQQNYGDIDPRVAFAWTPWEGGQTVIRGGFGIYHEDGQLDDQNLPAKNEVPSFSVKSTSSLQVTYPVDPVFYRSRNPLTKRRTTEPQGLVRRAVEPLGATGVACQLRGHGLLPGKPRRASAGYERGEPNQSGHRGGAISGLRSRHPLARLSRHEFIQRSLRGIATYVLPRLPGDGQLHLVARDRQRLQWQRRWRRNIAAESIVPGL